MIQNNAQTVKLTLKQTPVKNAKSRNVVCKIKGQDDEIIVFSAHYDSVPLSHGIYDNATGALTIYKLCRILCIPDQHTLVFVWCGSEEKRLAWFHCFLQETSETSQRLSSEYQCRYDWFSHQENLIHVYPQKMLAHC